MTTRFELTEMAAALSPGRSEPWAPQTIAGSYSSPARWNLGPGRRTDAVLDKRHALALLRFMSGLVTLVHDFNKLRRVLLSLSMPHAALQGCCSLPATLTPIVTRRHEAWGAARSMLLLTVLLYHRLYAHSRRGQYHSRSPTSCP